ncbi:MAG: hypothetical protein ACTTJS_05590, partial [Wolinella sp.]
NLPKDKGYLEVDFDTLSNNYNNDGSESRGYVMGEGRLGCDSSGEAPNLSAVCTSKYNAYARNPESLFSPLTARSKFLEARAGIYVSHEKFSALMASEGELFCLSEESVDSETLTLPIFSDSTMDGEWMAVSTCDYFADSVPLFKGGNRFANLRIERAKA